MLIITKNIEKSNNDNSAGKSKEADKDDQNIEEQKVEEEIIIKDGKEVLVPVNDTTENREEYQSSERENSTQFASPNKEPMVLGDIIGSPEAEEHFEKPTEIRLYEVEEEKQMSVPMSLDENKEDKTYFQETLITGSDNFLIKEDRNIDDLKLIPRPIEDLEFTKDGDLSESPVITTKRLSRFQAEDEALEENRSENRNESVLEPNRIRDVFRKFMNEEKPLVRHSVGGFPMMRDTENIQGEFQDNNGLRLFESIRRMSFEQKRENFYGKDESKEPQIGSTEKNDDSKIN